jgi:acyl-CoA reductase-like NAD-dependent aldehyde dehydrogenase
LSAAVDVGPARGGARLRVVNPATGAVIREVAEDTPDAVARKFAKAVRGQKEWARSRIDDRKAAIARFGQLAQERIEDLSATLTGEMGKPITQSRNEVKGLKGRIDFFLANVHKVLSEEEAGADADGRVEEKISYEPIGVVGNISAWNYPYFVGANVFVPALLTGNAVLYKPSEFASLTGLAIGELMQEAGVPGDVFQLVMGGGGVGAALLDQPLAGIYFTGSYATGRKVAESAARQLMRVQLELGGKDPVYVADDVADVEKVAAGVADGAFYNNGQSCCAVERVYVHERIHDRFVEAFLADVERFVVGDPLDEKTYIGPVARQAHLAVLEAQVADARAKGGRMLCGGARLERPGFFFAPTVFAQASHQMALMRDETFGPLIGIQKVASDDEALLLMNDTEYGLTASVYASDRDRAARVLSQVNAGSAYWNCCDRVSPRLPWSGRGHSGIGSTLGVAGIRAFVQPKAWHLRTPRP